MIIGNTVKDLNTSLDVNRSFAVFRMTGQKDSGITILGQHWVTLLFVCCCEDADNRYEYISGCGAAIGIVPAGNSKSFRPLLLVHTPELPDSRSAALLCPDGW